MNYMQKNKRKTTFVGDDVLGVPYNGTNICKDGEILWKLF